MSDNEPKVEQPDSPEASEVSPEKKTEESKVERVRIPGELPVLPLKGLVIYPGMRQALSVGREKSIKAVDEATVRSDRLIVLVTQRDEMSDAVNPQGLFTWGTAAVILTMFKIPDNTERVVVQGIARVRILDFTATEPCLRARVQEVAETTEDSIEMEALVRSTRDLFRQMLDILPNVPDEIKALVDYIKEPGRLADFIASNLPIGYPEKQQILEIPVIKERLKRVAALLGRELELLELGSKIESQAKEELTKAQREFFLRQQLKQIQKELGELDEKGAEVEEIRKKIEAAHMPEQVNAVALQELDRLTRIPPMSPEYTVSRNYLDWLTALPWAVSTPDNLEIASAAKVLDEDHYNLKKVKERILEFLAVLKLKQGNIKGPILCFLGPPGVGKTSLGKSIARALGRKFVRMSLGGIRDEAEIRGHRRTYVGALPGRVIQGVRNAGSNNPVFMLDEIDKVGVDFRGDPSSALLEVLDPEQNFAFSDHYLEVPFDLSKVMFITTANLLHPIPPALRDRMEVLELPGYTDFEKLSIAKNFLIPKQLEAHGLQKSQLTITDAAVKAIIRDYTREAGVRNLEREIAAVCRKTARSIAEGTVQSVNVTASDVKDHLGPVRFYSDSAERTREPGVATGLAWTATGGEILFVEATMMKGKKTLLLTGQLGDTMRESAEAAMSFVRSRAARFGIAEDFFEKYDVHIHVPAGATPKDGPSAGVAMVTAIVSLLTKTPVDHSVGMTGEITLRGRVLPVGGIKEKVLAAHRAGLKKIILPTKNRNDLEDVPQQVKEDLEFIFVASVEEAIDRALSREGTPRKSRAARPASADEVPVATKKK